MQLWLCPLLAFLLGSVPFGLWIAKSQGIDIRKHGSGNIGATNVFRVVGKKHGLICLVLDALKGFIPVVIAINLVPVTGRDPLLGLEFLSSFAMDPAASPFTAQIIHVLSALLAVLGHNYCPWIGFKGGKGVATSAGVLIALMPAAVLVLLGVFIVTLFVTRYVAVASIVAAICLPILTHIGARFHNTEEGLSLWEAGVWNKPLFFSLIIGLLAVWKHRSNIERLMQGTESRFTLKSKKNQKIT